MTSTGVGERAAVGVVLAMDGGGMYTYSGVSVLDYELIVLPRSWEPANSLVPGESMPLLSIVVKQVDPSHANRTASSHKSVPP